MRLQSERVLPVSQSDPPDLDSWNSKHPPFIMNLSLRSSAVLLLLSPVLAACAEGPVGEKSQDEHRTGSVQDDDDAAVALICDLNHQVVRLPASAPANGNGNAVGDPCDDFPGAGWEGEQLFASTAGPSVLDQYCSYTFVLSNGATDNHVADLLTLLPGSETGADCQAVTPQGQAITDAIGDELDQFFGYLAGRVDGTGLAEAYPDAIRGAVQTAVIDTYPNDQPDTPESSHGPVVMSIIEAIACPEGTQGCDIGVGAFLGLPRSENGFNYNDNGGVVGRQSDLARGVFEALEAHRASGSGRMVMNLSVGWESEHFGGSSPSDMPPPVRAVYDALRVARCEGILIIASAGNSTGLTCNEEALAPGRWEDIPAPTAAECTAIGASSFVPETATYRPLVHAVGGLFGVDSEMVSSRELGMPRLAAAASHAVARDRQGLTGDEMRTGTSLSSAVASAAASLVWSYRPEMSPARVMEVLYESGGLTSATADFGGGTSIPVRRVDACSAVEFVCALPTSDCGTTPGGHELQCDADPPVTLSGIVSTVENLPPAILKVREAVFGTVEKCDSRRCGDPIVFHPHDTETRECDDVERDPWSWLTSPQPTTSGCSDCILTTTTIDPTVLLTVDEKFASDTLVAIDVVVVDKGGTKFVYSLKDVDTGMVPALDESKVATYQVPFDLNGVEAVEATVLMTFASGTETEDPMLLR